MEKNSMLIYIRKCLWTFFNHADYLNITFFLIYMLLLPLFFMQPLMDYNRSDGFSWAIMAFWYPQIVAFLLGAIWLGWLIYGIRIKDE
jgi:hypothetical protein